MIDILEAKLQRGKQIMETLQSIHPKTRGHLPNSGLRGHSVDHHTYPWRVVCWPHGGRGGQVAWAVEGPAGIEIARYDGEDGIYSAHAAARAWKCLHPGGEVELGPEGQCNVSGAPETVLERLEGCFILFKRNGYNIEHYERLEGLWRVCDAQDQAPAGKTITLEFVHTPYHGKLRITALPILTLQHCKHFDVELPIRQFFRK